MLDDDTRRNRRGDRQNDRQSTTMGHDDVSRRFAFDTRTSKITRSTGSTRHLCLTKFNMESF